MTQAYLQQRRSRGVGLVTAIFLLVVLAGLAVAMVSIFTAQQSSSALDVQGARAYQAARAGIEWGLYDQLHDNPASCVGKTTSFALPAGTSLDGFWVTVAISCPATGGAAQLARRVIVATACAPAVASCPNASTSPDYVQRVLEVQI